MYILYCNRYLVKILLFCFHFTNLAKRQVFHGIAFKNNNFFQPTLVHSTFGLGTNEF